MKEATIVDAISIAAAGSTKDKKSKKPLQRIKLKTEFEMKVYLDMEAKTGSIYRLSTTAANVRSFLMSLDVKNK